MCIDRASEQISKLYNWPGFYEPFSALSHLIGAAVFVVLGVLIVWRGRGCRLRLLFLGIYAASVVFLLSMSGVYHMVVRGGTAHRVLARLDHSAIFVLIAGSFTPAHGILFRGWLRWGSLLLIWAAAAAGIVLKTVFFADLADWTGLTSYLVFGWCGVFSAIALAQRYGFGLLRPLLFGGLAYSIGGILDYIHWPELVPGVIRPHDVFHLAVLAGAFYHWLFNWQFASGEFCTDNFSAP